jgi:hypothetical protein
MSQARFADWLFSVGTGWLGWAPDVVLLTPIPMILLALEGRAEYLRAINGVPDPADAAAPEVTVENSPDALVSVLRGRALNGGRA